MGPQQFGNISPTLPYYAPQQAVQHSQAVIHRSFPGPIPSGHHEELGPRLTNLYGRAEQIAKAYVNTPDRDRDSHLPPKVRDLIMSINHRDSPSMVRLLISTSRTR